ncbi:hypothetical protein PT2222_30175 [Paraburkholderia tropica]
MENDRWPRRDIGRSRAEARLAWHDGFHFPIRNKWRGFFLSETAVISESKLFIRPETYVIHIKQYQYNSHMRIQENPKCRTRQVVDSIHKTYTNISIDSRSRMETPRKSPRTHAADISIWKPGKFSGAYVFF